VVEERDGLRHQLQEAERSLASAREKLEMGETSNKQLVAQINYLTQTNESLMEDIDDVNERMSNELANCRQERSVAEVRCTQLETHCEKLTELELETWKKISDIYIFIVNSYTQYGKIR